MLDTDILKELNTTELQALYSLFRGLPHLKQGKSTTGSIPNSELLSMLATYGYSFQSVDNSHDTEYSVNTQYTITRLGRPNSWSLAEKAQYNNFVSSIAEQQQAVTIFEKAKARLIARMELDSKANKQGTVAAYYIGRRVTSSCALKAIALMDAYLANNKLMHKVDVDKHNKMVIAVNWNAEWTPTGKTSHSQQKLLGSAQDYAADKLTGAAQTAPAEPAPTYKMPTDSPTPDNPPVPPSNPPRDFRDTGKKKPEVHTAAEFLKNL